MSEPSFGPAPPEPPISYPPYPPYQYPPWSPPPAASADATRRHGAPRRPWWLMDRQLAWLRRTDPRPWGAAVIGWPVLALVGGLLVTGVIVLALDASGLPGAVSEAVAGLGFYAALVIVALVAGRPIAARYGGWTQAFGLIRPRWMDPVWALATFVGGLATRIALFLLVFAVAPSWRDTDYSNVDKLSGLAVAELVYLVALTVIIAPVVEELLFRGVLLHAGAHRFGFWPAAIVTSLGFGLLHTPQVSFGAPTVLLGGSLAMFGLLQCLIVRFTGSLVPAVLVHMLSNGLALAVALN
ncbi:MAG: type II CAAX endopeptidase family protein [bacterium]